MTFLKNIFNVRHKQLRSYDEFWEWFLKNEKRLHLAVKNSGEIETKFFDVLRPKLHELKDGILVMTGMLNDDIAEMVLTAEGVIKNIVFVEELISAAPIIPGWKFTALKPAFEDESISIETGGKSFNHDNLSFYYTTDERYPDEIEITIVRDNEDEEQTDLMRDGIYIFLDNYLGELDFAINIDNLAIVRKKDATHDLIPLEQLKPFLKWRQKEFIEKYEGARHNTANDNYSILEAELDNGSALIAVINTDVLAWDRKASHPWIVSVEIRYDGKSNNGMPDKSTYSLLEEIEEDIAGSLTDYEGHLYIGRQTAENVRELFYACKDFRKPSKVLYEIEKTYKGTLDISFDIYKDKYWQSFQRFNELK
jgi:uncharacterized protein DUF695